MSLKDKDIYPNFSQKEKKTQTIVEEDLSQIMEKFMLQQMIFEFLL